MKNPSRRIYAAVGWMMLSVASVSAQNGWYEDFEHYAPGAFPAPNWTLSGNSDIKIDNNFRASGGQSVRLYGWVGECWGALLHRPLNISPPFTIEFQTRNGSEPLSGCHPLRSVMALHAGASWTTPGRKIISFDGDGKIRGSASPSNSYSGSVLSAYATGEWIKTKITLERSDDATVRLSYWINDQFKKSEVLAALSYESQFSYLSLQAAEGTAWFDDIKITPGVGPSPVSITTTTVPTLQVGLPSSFKFDATLGQPPYTWSLASGTLPPGMALRSDGTVTGTPTQAGQFTFSIRVQDSLGTTAVSSFTLAVVVQASGGLLVEDFEDGILDPRISVQTTGTFSTGPGIKNVANFGSTKAFGFGLSTCGASCFSNFVSTLRITFPLPEFVVNISFKEMELFSNWGSGGGVFVDGQPLTANTAPQGFNSYNDFGRSPYNDFQSDTTFRSRSFPVNRLVTTIDLRVADITNGSEIYIDDLVIAGLPVPFTFVDRGGVSLRSSGNSPATVVGYASIQPNSGSTAPSGLAIFGFRQNNILVTEASVPASALLQSGRIYAEVNGSINTGLAMANPNAQPATVSFFFTGPNGNFGNGITTVPANGQIAKFLNEAPFNGGSSMSGAFTFTSSVPIAVVALRGLTNERGDFLVTTLPVADISAPAGSGTIIFPQFAEGGGWTTQIVLVNPGDTLLTGTVQFLDPSGGTASVVVNGQANSGFAYSIPARTSQKLQTAGTSTSTQSGSVRVIPAPGTTAPSGLGIFSFRNGGITVTEAGVPAVPAGTAFRLYTQAAGTLPLPGSIQTGVAVVNVSSSAATVILELHRLDGSSTGLIGTLSVPANGRVASFLSEIQGFASLQKPFQGVLRVSSSSSISVIGLRGRYNERGDFLITTMPASNEATPPSTATLLFPHIVDSGGYTTQFVLLSGQAGQSSSGTLRLFSQSGTALGLTFTGTSNASTILYSTGFESPTYSLGPLASKDGWSVLRTSAAVNVQSTVVASGSQAVVIDATIAVDQTGPHHVAVSSTSDTYVLMEADVRLAGSSDMTAWQFAGLSCDDLTEQSCQFIGGFNVLADGRLQIITAGFPLTAPVMSRDVWNHYAVLYNFSSQTFDTYINGALVAARNPLYTARTTFGRFIFDTFDSATGNDKGYIDNVQIATVP